VGVRNKERRAAKAKERQRRARERAARDPLDDDHLDLGAATRARWVHDTLVAALDTVDFDQRGAPVAGAQSLADAATRPDFGPLIDNALVYLVSAQVAGLWKRGWQPADVVRVLRRGLKVADLVATMAADSMAADIATFAPATVDERFTDQLASLRADPHRWQATDFVRRWTEWAGVGGSEVIGSVIVLAEALSRLPAIGALCPLPGQARRGHATNVTGADPKVLRRVRGLLAKAESSGYEAEADSLTAKAQELMARYSIDHALLTATEATADEPGGLRIGVDNPYESEKAMLLDQVARANRCQAIHSRRLGFVTVLGFPADLRAVEVLYTSLLVQVTRTMLREGSRPLAGGGNRTVAFRRSFQQAFAVHIGERLAGVSETAVREGAASDDRLLPVLAGREQAVRRFADKLFPDVTHEWATGGYDREGWSLGTHAADLAPLTAIPSLRGDEVNPVSPVPAPPTAAIPAQR
jgi:hypothetical protein